MNPAITWTFSDFLNELIHLDEISEIPGVNEKRQNIIDQMWEFFPQESVEIGLIKKVKS